MSINVLNNCISIIENENYLSAMDCIYEVKYCADKNHRKINHENDKCLTLTNVKIVGVNIDLIYYNLSGIKSKSEMKEKLNLIDMKCLINLCQSYYLHSPDIWEMKIEQSKFGEIFSGTRLKKSFIKKELLSKLNYLNTLNENDKKAWIL